MYSNISVAVFVYAKCSCSSLTPDLTAFLSSGCRLLRTLWSEWCVRPRALSVPPCYVGSSTGFHAVRQRISCKLDVITYKTNLTKTSAYLSDMIHEYYHTRTLRSADITVTCCTANAANIIGESVLRQCPCWLELTFIQL